MDLPFVPLQLALNLLENLTLFRKTEIYSIQVVNPQGMPVLPVRDERDSLRHQRNRSVEETQCRNQSSGTVVPRTEDESTDPELSGTPSSTPPIPKIESAPFTVDPVLIFDDTSIGSRNNFDKIDLVNVTLYVLREEIREITLPRQHRFVVRRCTGGGVTVAEQNRWRRLNQTRPVKAIGEYPYGIRTSLPGSRVVAQFWRKPDRSLTLYSCQLNREMILGGQRCRFSASVIDHLHLAAIRKHSSPGTELKGIALLVTPKRELTR